MDYLEKLRAFINQELTDWGQPGAAVALIVDGEPMLVDGFGLGDVTEQTAVTSDTVFGIGSITKPVLTTLMGILIDEGLLAWDTPVRDYLPEFALKDPVSTRLSTLRDLACHRTGLSMNYFMYHNAQISVDDLLKRVPHLEMGATFREKYQYSNLMYVVMAKVIERVTGQSWASVLQDRLLGPLGMTSVSTTHAALSQAANVALQYKRHGREITCMEPTHSTDHISAAGGINAHINDMATWLALHINGGQHEGRQIVQTATLSEMHTPQMMITDPEAADYISTRDELGYNSYGLGWQIRTYRGHWMVNHAGNIGGYYALASFLPFKKAGVVVLCNSALALMTYTVTFRAYDLLLGLEPIPWSSRLQGVLAGMAQRNAARLSEDAAKRIADTRTAHKMFDYTGIYSHPGYGTFIVKRDDDGLVLIYNDVVYRLEHYHYEVFNANSQAADLYWKCTFLTDPDTGKVNGATFNIEPGVVPIMFDRVLAADGNV